MGGGGTVWDSLAYDPELNLLYVGTGNGSPWNQEVRSPGGGDNLYLSSILALRPDSGELVWHYQTTPGESWDFTATQHMILADLNVEGRQRKVLMQAPKNGFFYILERQTGELISAEPYIEPTWAKAIDKKTGRPIENPLARYKDSMALLRPGPLGGHNWQPMSYNPQTSLVYIPIHESYFAYAQDRKFKYVAGLWNLGIDFTIFTDPLPDLPPGHLIAWDPISQKERWRVTYKNPWNGGTLTTAGNLVFQGTGDGRFVAYSADKGEKLWEAGLGTGVIASPVTYEVNGVQYVSIMAGWGGALPLSIGSANGTARVPGRLLTFALNGRGTLQDVSTHALPAATPITFNASPERVRAGAVLYSRWCSVCHGVAASGGGVIADLRYSSPAIYDKYQQIVIGGSMAGVGMPSFKQWLSAEEVESIRAFVLKRRADLAGKK
jgi:quinohemoprotein ethanol dehydrogenase